MALIVLRPPTALGAWVFPTASNLSACRRTFGRFCGKQTHSSWPLTTRERHWCSWKQWLVGSRGFPRPGALRLCCPPESAVLLYRPGPRISWRLLWRISSKTRSVGWLWAGERDTERKPISERRHTWRDTSKLLDRFQLRQNKIRVVINVERNEDGRTHCDKNTTSWPVLPVFCNGDYFRLIFRKDRPIPQIIEIFF